MLYGRNSKNLRDWGLDYEATKEIRFHIKSNNVKNVNLNYAPQLRSDVELRLWETTYSVSNLMVQLLIQLTHFAESLDLTEARVDLEYGLQ